MSGRTPTRDQLTPEERERAYVEELKWLFRPTGSPEWHEICNTAGPRAWEEVVVTGFGGSHGRRPRRRKN